MTNNNYNLFNDVNNPTLKTWNRCATMFSILKDKDTKTMVEYASNFSFEERTAISKMFERVKTEGYSKVRALINQEVVSGQLS